MVVTLAVPIKRADITKLEIQNMRVVYCPKTATDEIDRTSSVHIDLADMSPALVTELEKLIKADYES